MAFQGYSQHANQDQCNAAEVSICIAFLKPQHTYDYAKNNHQVGRNTIYYGAMSGNDLEGQPVSNTGNNTMNQNIAKGVILSLIHN